MTRKLAIVVGVILLVIASFATLYLYYTYHYNRFARGTTVAGFSISKLTPDQAKEEIQAKVIPPSTIVLSSQNKQSFEIPLAEVQFFYDFDKTIENAKKESLNTKPINILNKRSAGIDSPLIYSLDENKLREHVNTIVSQIAIDPIYPSAKLLGKTVTIEKGSAGTQVETGQIINEISQNLSFLKGSTVNVVATPVDPTLAQDQVEQYLALAQKYIGRNIKIEYEFQNFNLTDEEIVAMLLSDNSWDEEKLQTKVQNIATLVNRDPQNSIFSFTNNKVTEFVPSKNGLTVKEDELMSSLLDQLNTLDQNSEKLVTIAIPVESTSPKISNSEVNDLGIKELIGRGTSTFKGSIPGRIHNVALAASNINGTLIKPGETFSFNQALGDVSKLTGYKEAYVIKDGRTVLGDGGGVCQVSTTFFRAAMNSGLPIFERRGHSYRVGYYEQDSGPGLDATVYAPTTDLKIVNDTPGHILVQTQTDTKNMSLVFEFYGTSDGRVSTVTKPVITSSTAPPEDLYVDDPTLPTGKVNQIEHKAWGARTVFGYEVKRNGEVIYQKSFVTNYRPWQAVFMRGTGPV